MSSDKTSVFMASVPLRLKSKNDEIARSIQVTWSGALGVLDGEVKIYGSNDREGLALIATVIIDIAAGSELIELFPIKFIQAKYNSNHITSGYLTVTYLRTTR
jgi:hypothetical protein